MTTLFLFAHQDDEIGVFYEISRTLAKGQPLRCIYLTNGAWDGVSPRQRNQETIKVLTSLGVQREDIIFLGETLGIYDGKLVEHLETAQEALQKIARELKTVSRIICHAWEGGHQDHDAVHLSGLALAKKLGILENTFQFPLYRMPAGRFWLTFAKPLPQNGEIISQKIPWSKRLFLLGKLRHYRSQAWIMLKIGYHMAWYSLVDGREKLQPVSLSRAYERPNTGMMLYECWKLYKEQDFKRQARPFLEKHIG